MVGHAFPGPLARGDGVPVESYEQSGESVMLAVGGDGAAEQGAVLALAYLSERRVSELRDDDVLQHRYP